MGIDFRKVVDAARDGVAVLDGEGRYLYANDPAVQLAGSRREDMLGRSFRELWPEMAGTPFDESFRRVARTGVGESTEAPSLRPGMWIRFDIAPVGEGLLRVTWHEISDRKKLEEERRQSVEHLAAAVEAAGLGTWEFDPVAKAVVASPRMLAMLGLSPADELTMESFFEMCHPDDRARMQATLQRALCGEQVQQAEYRVRRRDGVQRWLRASSRALYVDGKLLRLIGTTVDITEAKGREQAQLFLAKAGEVLNSSLDGRTTVETVARLAIRVLGDACTVDLFEGGALRRVEVAYDESVGDPGVLRIRSTPVEKYPPSHPIVQASRGRTILITDYTDELARQNAAGPEHLAAVREARVQSLLSVPLLAHGEVLGVISFFWRAGHRHGEEDRALAEEVARRMALAIDNARRHEQLQAALRERLQIVELVEQSRDFIGFASLDGIGQFLNRAGLELVGVTRDEVVGKSIASFFVPEDLPLAQKNVEQALAAGASEVELRFRNFRTGAAIPVSWNVFVLRNARGEPDCLATITRDLSEQKRVALEREHLIERLQRALRVSEVFVGILGHDLRNPLSAMVTAAQLLQRTGDERVVRTAARILSSGRRMSDLIEDLLDFTRIRVGQGISLQPRDANLMELCSSAVEELREANPSRTIACVCRGDPKGRWDADRVAQVISNLVGNAVRHSPPQSPIEVTLDGLAKSAVRLRVHNEGPPIPQELRAGLFDPFKRVAQRREQGLGLGLYISDQIARLHGGHLEVESSECDGTAFTLELPRQSEA